ncbi:hypothetical protein Tco_0321162 [Tanacetum coccineum]
MYEHVSPQDTRSQDGERSQDDDQRSDLANDLKSTYQCHRSPPSKAATDNKVSKKILNKGEGYDHPDDSVFVQGFLLFYFFHSVEECNVCVRTLEEREVTTMVPIMVEKIRDRLRLKVRRSGTSLKDPATILRDAGEFAVFRKFAQQRLQQLHQPQSQHH